MRIGLHLTSHHEPGGNTHQLLETLLRQVSRAEELGFSHVFLGHHYLTSSAFLQPLPLASFLAARTSRIRIGFGVLLMPLIPPVSLAEDLATLDALSNGRVIVGLGAGYRPSEFDALDIPMDQRYRRLESGVRVMRELWTGNAVSREDLFGKLSSATLHLRPQQPGGPPIWLGARGSRGLRRVAELDACWLTLLNFPDEVFEQQLLLLRNELRNRTLPLARDYPVIADVFVAESDAAALGVARRYARVPGHVEQTRDSIDGYLRNSVLTGSPDTVLQRLKKWRDKFGVTDVIFRLDWNGASDAELSAATEMIGTHIIPEFSVLAGQHR
ncbi:MAG: LLM class flavin-dependent oxidoreductase [Hyphomicrobiales bacterium]|nr:MAG: LLM class flavin-dependent oxidoreductase [Hyphomicrobiales bacterium]